MIAEKLLKGTLKSQPSSSSSRCYYIVVCAFTPYHISGPHRAIGEFFTDKNKQTSSVHAVITSDLNAPSLHPSISWLSGPDLCGMTCCSMSVGDRYARFIGAQSGSSQPWAWALLCPCPPRDLVFMAGPRVTPTECHIDRLPPVGGRHESCDNSGAGRAMV